jgi:hypothetical protein
MGKVKIVAIAGACCLALAIFLAVRLKPGHSRQAVFAPQTVGAITTSWAYGSPAALSCVTATFTSDASGTVEGIVPYDTYAAAKYLGGLLYRATVAPASGALRPDNLFDVTLLDVDSKDVLQGQFQNLTSATATTVNFSTPTAFIGPHTLSASGMGNKKEASLRLYFR